MANTFALLCSHPQNSSSCWTEQTDSWGVLRKPGVSAHPSLSHAQPVALCPLLPAGGVTSTITQKLNRQPWSCAYCHCSSLGHTAAEPPLAQPRVWHSCAAALGGRQHCRLRAMPKETCGTQVCSADSAEAGMGCGGMSTGSPAYSRLSSATPA